MRALTFAAIATLLAPGAFAQGPRQLGAHEHGVGQLDIAFEGDRVSMEFHGPGADIVGFEHAAESAGDRAALDRALADLARPLELFVLPEAAQCTVTQAGAELSSEDEERTGETHSGQESGEGAEGEEHADHEEHGAEHTEFHAEYVLTCADPAALTRIDFPYFERFPNARELEVQIVSETGARAYAVGRDAPALVLEGLI